MNLREETKEQLLTEIEGTSAWRAEKAEEYPEDAERNNNSSNELVKLHTYIAELSADHPLFLAMTRILDADKSMVVLEEQNHLISRYGFHRDLEDPEAFINQLTELYLQA